MYHFPYLIQKLSQLWARRLQTTRKRLYSNFLIGSRLKIFVVSSIIAITCFLPLVIPHLAEPSAFFHTLLHLGGVSIALFLSLISFIAFKRVNTVKMLLMMMGFFALTGVEIIYLLDSAGTFQLLQIPSIAIELPHVLLLGMLALFGIGVLYCE